MEILIKILCLASFGALLQNFEYYQVLLRKTNLDCKPFNCTLCGSFWVALVYFLLSGDSLIASVLLASPVGVLAELIDRQLLKL